MQYSQFTPYSFYEAYFAKRKLQKLTNKKLIYTTNLTMPHCDLSANTIYLPFVHPLTLKDLKILLKHEELHFKYTKYTPDIFILSNNLQRPAATVHKALNYLEDMYINKHISRNDLERIIKKIGHEKHITLFYHYKDDERKEAIEYMKEIGELKEDINVDEAVELFNEAIEKREKYDSLEEFVKNEEELVSKIIELYNDTNELVGSGPTPQSNTSVPPDFDLLKKFNKILRRFRTITRETIYEEKMYGKRINRKFIETPVCIKPFVHKYDKTTVHKPNILMLIDTSGSMHGRPMAIAKALVMSILQNCNAKAIFHGQYIHAVVTEPSQVKYIPADGDDDFNTLRVEEAKKYNPDIFILISDNIIDKQEALNLYDYVKSINANKKYYLVTCDDDPYDYKFFDEVMKRIIVETDEDKFIEFLKKLVAQYV